MMEILNYLFHNTFFLVMVGLTLLFAVILIYFRVSDDSKKKTTTPNEEGEEPHGKGGHGGDDHHPEVESKRAFIMKVLLLVQSFITLVVIAILFIRAYKEVSLDKDDDKVAKQAAEQAMMEISNRVTFRIPAGNRGRTIQFTEANGFMYGQSYIYNPDDAYKVTIVTATGREPWDDGPDMPRGEAVGPDDWPITIISRQGEIPAFPFERVGKYNK